MNLIKRYLLKFSLIILIFFIFISCASDRLERNNYNINDFMDYASNPKNINILNNAIKLHTINGEVYILNDYVIIEKEKIVKGSGVLQDINRFEKNSGDFQIPFDSIVIVETNNVKGNNGIIGMAIVTGISLYTTFYCIANPKACFGSCPTFYTFQGDKEILQAEGFSTSIAPCMEVNDIDHLYLAKPDSRDFKILMKNEALETHIVRYVDLLAVERQNNHRIFNSPDGKFFETSSIHELSAAYGDEGNCVESLKYYDNQERYSLADSNKLTNKEEVILQFDEKLSGKSGLILDFRQTLLNTYVFYQTLSFMGTNAGSWYAQLERSKKFENSLFNLNIEGFNEIEVFCQNNENQWVKCGVFNETGPIAQNIQLMPIYQTNNNNKTLIKLKMTKGQWRLNYAALCDIEKQVQPIRIKPYKIINNTNKLYDFTDFNSGVKPLITMPGDQYNFYYNLPENFQNYELFLDSKGYYLEWMRKEWLAEENNGMIYKLISDGKGYLDLLTPGFKKIEASMEKTFWSSRYVKQ